jgi:acylphosphatase
VIINGRVQGVWFRAWTAQEAESLGLDGWVRNRMDGTVEAAFSGEKNAVEEMLRRCHEGPRAARVDSVEPVALSEPVKQGFHQFPTV